MTKRTGLAEYLHLGGYDLSGDVGGIEEAATPMSPLPATGIDKEAVERLDGRRDGMLSFKAFMNDATGAAHDRLSTLPTSDQYAVWLIGDALGDPAMAILGKQVNYDGTRDEDGNLTYSVDIPANGFGAEWGHNLTGDGTNRGIFASAGAEDAPGFDDGAGAATGFGLQMYWQLLSFTGTSVTLTIEDSDDDGTDPYATVTGATSGALNAVGAGRVQTSRTENVKEWLRVAASGTYSAATFVVVVVRNLSSVTF